MDERDTRTFQPGPDDTLIFCRLEYVGLTAEGNGYLEISKENKEYLGFLIKFLKEFEGSDCSLCLRMKRGESRSLSQDEEEENV